MIFLSFNNHDKPIVEPIALSLREIFGQEKVFFFPWSIQPGEDIIGKMSDGIGDLKFLFFFVSERSAKSEMVGLEWRNALLRATKGECKIVPVRIDGTDIPHILRTSLYLDFYSNGPETTLSQIINVVQGLSTYTTPEENFSNLSALVTHLNPCHTTIRVTASHYPEHGCEIILATNPAHKIYLSPPIVSGSYMMGPDYGVRELNSGIKSKLVGWKAPDGLISPRFPLEFYALKQGFSPGMAVPSALIETIEIHDVLHRAGSSELKSIPTEVMREF